MGETRMQPILLVFSYNWIVVERFKHWLYYWITFGKQYNRNEHLASILLFPANIYAKNRFCYLTSSPICNIIERECRKMDLALSKEHFHLKIKASKQGATLKLEWSDIKDPYTIRHEAKISGNTHTQSTISYALTIFKVPYSVTYFSVITSVLM